MPLPQDGPDVLFHGSSATGTLSELAVDLGGWEDDFTVDTGVITSTSNARFDVYENAALEFRVNCNDTDTGYLWTYGTNHRLRFSSGAVTLLVNGVAVIDYTVVDISGSNDDFLVTWSWQENPLTTGSSDAYRSELVVRNETNGSWEFATAVHAEPPDGTDDAVIGGVAPGCMSLRG